MCSYGGHIVPRPHDKSLCYAGGDTRMVVVDRHSSLPDLLSRLSKILLNGRSFTLKYQLPNEDLDSLITVSTEEDLENMVDEYDRLMANSNPSKPSRIRLFLFPTKPETASSLIGPILDGSNKSEDWFLSVLNGTGVGVLQRGFSDPTSVDCLLGLGENVNGGGNNNNSAANSESNSKDVEKSGKFGNQNNGSSNQDVHSVPDSPVIETTSSFGSTSSSPSLANLPPIRVHVEDGGGGGNGGVRVLDHQRIGIEEQFAQMGLGLQKQLQQDEGGFVVLSSPPTVPPNVAPASTAATVVTGMPAVLSSEYLNRVVSDDERSDQGVPVAYRKPSPPQTLQPMVGMPSQPQSKQVSGDLPSPDSVSSDSSLSNAISRQKPMVYQEQVAQIPSGGNRVSPNLVDPKVNASDPNAWVQMQQNSDSLYAVAPQYDLQQLQQLQQQHHHHQQLLQQQQQQLQQQQQQQLQQQQQQQLQQQQQQQQQLQPQAQQFIHAGQHFVQHHPSGAVPISTYYPVYPSQQPHLHHQLDQRYPVYYISAGQAQAYSLPVQQPNFSEAATAVPSSRSQTPPNPTIITSSAAYNAARNMPPKPEMAAGMYRTAANAAPPLVQVPSGQHPPQQQQFMGYSQIHHHPSQSATPTSAATGSYAYEFSDPAHTQLYFTQPLQPSLAAQYQTMTSAPGMVLPDASVQLPTETVKQQGRSSQPL
ncbi:hypothetical protein Ancab_018538 [Ancistrocladus abbreviatus]